MRPLDSDLLRSFLAVHEAGSITGGAGRIGRSQSATSLQISQLEGIVGKPVFLRHGRGIVLSEAGERLLPVARKVTRDLDSVLSTLQGTALTGRLRIRLPEEYASGAFIRIMADFCSRYPDVELETHCAVGTDFRKELDSGSLDLALNDEPHAGDGEVLRRARLSWQIAKSSDLAAREVLPIALFDQDCWWREAALDSLEEAGQRYRIVFSSENAASVHAAVEAGLAAGFMNSAAPRKDLVPVPGLTTGRDTCLILRTGKTAQNPPVVAIRKLIQDFYANPTA